MSAIEWTDRHQLAALRRLFAIASKRLETDGLRAEPEALRLVARAVYTEEEFRSALRLVARLSAAFIDREVKTVRRKADQR